MLTDNDKKNGGSPQLTHIILAVYIPPIVMGTVAPKVQSKPKMERKEVSKSINIDFFIDFMY